MQWCRSWTACSTTLTWWTCSPSSPNTPPSCSTSLRRDCYTTGHPVSVADLREARGRWRRFVDAAIKAGFTSVHAVPMRAAGTVLGALGLFGTETGDLNDADQLHPVDEINLIGRHLLADQLCVARHRSMIRLSVELRHDTRLLDPSP